MNRKKLARNFAISMVLLSNIGCDQVSKNLARTHIDYGQTIEVISNHFLLTKVENTGAFLSLGNTLPELLRVMLLTVMPILVMLGMIYYLFAKTNLHRNLSLGLAFIIGGGIGNLIDRVKYGSVTDFLFMDFHFFKTGIFNLADVSIVVGTILILTAYYLPGKHKGTIH